MFILCMWQMNILAPEDKENFGKQEEVRCVSKTATSWNMEHFQRAVPCQLYKDINSHN